MSDVHVVALGARTPVGLTAESTAAAVRAGITRMVRHPFLVDLRGLPVRVALDLLLDPALFGAARMLELARSALDEVAEKLGRAVVDREAVDLVVGLPEVRAGFSEQDGQQLASELSHGSSLGRRARMSASMTGHAAALEALGVGVDAVRSGRSDLCIVGGVDTYLEPDTLLQLDAHRQLAAETVRSGFVPGEGACFVALATARRCAEAGLTSLAQVVAVQSARETKLVKTNAICIGEGLTEAIAGAARAGHGRQTRVDDVYCDINGERYRTEEWGFALLRTADLWRDPTAYTTTVAECGDAGAASGTLLVTLAVQAIQRGYANGPNAMIWASSEGGLRTAALLTRAGV